MNRIQYAETSSYCQPNSQCKPPFGEKRYVLKPISKVCHLKIGNNNIFKTQHNTTIIECFIVSYRVMDKYVSCEEILPKANSNHYLQTDDSRK